MASTRPTVYTVDEYDPLEFDAVLVRENAVVCVDGTDEVRMVPMDKVNHVDGDPDEMLIERELPDTFYGGGEYGFVNVEEYPELRQHLEELAAEEY
ncbi:hypothetical protein NGM10_16165 (plasmid) [Halorussus salilacus]|uniref:hypothetical protein n=1 Tax=Halorussus salilacus TaxID=2953750 RepID=UPI0020A1EE1C|nr:hypothetical protein [Halorussus salilacus]USZ69937.1 hypothetical protein NGM10_16165 [Halorussus salilacus]